MAPSSALINGAKTTQPVSVNLADWHHCVGPTLVFKIQITKISEINQTLLIRLKLVEDLLSLRLTKLLVGSTLRPSLNQFSWTTDRLNF